MNLPTPHNRKNRALVAGGVGLASAGLLYIAPTLFFFVMFAACIGGIAYIGMNFR